MAPLGECSVQTMTFHAFVLNIKEEMVICLLSQMFVKQASKQFNFMNIFKFCLVGTFITDA